MTAAKPDFNGASWATSTYSGGNEGTCIEVAVAGPWVGVRDTKQRGRGPIHAFSHPAWTAFLVGVRNREFDRP